MALLFNRAKHSTATTGTGTITLGAAVTGFGTFGEAGVADGNTVSYVIEDGNDFEIGTGVYTASGTTMTRASVTFSKISGTAGTSKINLSGSATVFLTARKEDIANAATSVSAGGIATGGGTLAADRTITVTAAVQSDQETATSTSVAVVPGVQQYHPCAAKAWLRWTTITTSAIAASYNVTSLTDNGTGDTTVNFTVAFSSGNYGAATCSYSISGTGGYSLTQYNPTAPTGSAFRLLALTYGNVATDLLFNSASFFGDQ